MLLRLKGTGPRYRQVYAALRAQILEGTLAAGTRLPGSRRLARDLGFSRIVVLAAYEQLAAEGFIRSQVGAGSRVALPRDTTAPSKRKRSPRPRADMLTPRLSAYAARARQMAPHRRPAAKRSGRQPRFDFSYSDQMPEDRTLRLWRRCLAQAARAGDYAYPDPAGLAPLRQAIATYLREHRGTVAADDQVIVVNGSQQALDLIARALCDPGDLVGIEDPHYQGTRQVLTALGAVPVACPVTDGGFDIESHQQRLRHARAVYVTPSHQFPTGAVMSAERRMRLLQWAAERAAWIIEDDYDCEFRYGIGAIPALQGMDAARRVLYVGTFARALFPGLRLGFIISPPALCEPLKAMKWLSDRGSSPLEQRALASFIASGAYERSRRRLARIFETRRAALLDALERHLPPGELLLSGSASGTHIFLRLPRIPAASTAALLSESLRRGVRVYSGTPYFLAPPAETALLLGYGTLATGQIETAVAEFAAAYRVIRRRRARTCA